MKLKCCFFRGIVMIMVIIMVMCGNVATVLATETIDKTVPEINIVETDNSASIVEDEIDEPIIPESKIEGIESEPGELSNTSSKIESIDSSEEELICESTEFVAETYALPGEATDSTETEDNIYCDYTYYGECGEELVWGLDEESGVLSISGNGVMYDYSQSPWLEYEEMILTLQIEEGVISIGKNAFTDLTNLKTVKMADTVESIGFEAFAYCESLDDVNLSVSWNSCPSYNSTMNANYCGQIFEGCESLKTIIVPEGMEALPGYAFNGADYLESVVFPESITEIKNHTFYNCSNLKEIVIPEQVTAIGKSAFCYCSSLSSIEFKTNILAELGHFAFNECSSLTSIDLPDSIQSIGYRAFAYCYDLEEINIPVAWTECPTSATDGTINATYCGHIFEDCYSLKNIVLPQEWTTLPSYAFAYCDEIETIQMPETLESIANHVFYSCSSLKEIVIPKGVISIKKSAFCYCYDLEKVTFETEDLQEIYLYAFNGCNSLKEITLPDSVEKIGYKAFADCSVLEKVNLPLNWTECPSSATDGTISSTYCGYIFSNCPKFLTASIPEGSTLLPAYAFANCGSLLTVKLPDTLEKIGKSAFINCSKLTDIKIPEKVNEIESYAFSGCSNLEAITIPENVTDIKVYTFRNCNSLTAVSFGENIKQVEDNAFANCTNISLVTYAAQEEDAREIVLNNNSTLQNGDILYGILMGVEFPDKILESHYTQPEGETCTSFYGGSVYADTDYYDMDIEEASFGPNCRDIFFTLPKDSYVTYGFSKAIKCPDGSKILIRTTGNMDERADLYARILTGQYVFLDTVYEKQDLLTATIRGVDDYITGIKVVGRDLGGATPGFDLVTLSLFGSLSDIESDFSTNTTVTMKRGTKAYDLLKEKQVFRVSEQEEASILVSPDWNGHEAGMIAIYQDNKKILENAGGAFVDIVPSQLFASGKDIYVLLTDVDNEIVDYIKLELAVMSKEEEEVEKLQLSEVFYRYGSIYKDVMTTVHAIEIDHAAFDIEVKATYPEEVTSYKLISGSKEIATNTTGIFEEVDPSKFTTGETVYVLTENEKTTVKTKLFLNIKEPKGLEKIKGSSLTLGGSAINLKLPDDVPVIGGSDVNLSLPASLPVSAVIEDGKLKIGINVAEKCLHSADSYNGLTTSSKTETIKDNLQSSELKKKFQEWQYKSLKSSYILKDMKGYVEQANLKADMPLFSDKVDVQVIGYFETTWSDQIETVSGQLMIALSGKAEFQHQTVIVCIPVTLNVTVSGSVSAIAELGYDFVGEEFFADLGINMSLSLEPYAGVGAGTWASVGVYGNLTGNVDVVLLATKSSGKTPGLDEVSLEGSMGLKAYFAKEEIGHLELISTKALNKTRFKTYMDGRKLLLYSRSKNSVLRGLDSQSETMAAEKYSTKVLNENAEVLVSEQSVFDGSMMTGEKIVDAVYPAANPKIVTVDGQKILLYIDNDMEREGQNQTAAYYSLYSQEYDAFLAPKALDPDGTADFNINTFRTENGDLYVYFSDACKVFDDVVELSEYAIEFGLSVYKYNRTEDMFEEMFTIHNDKYAYNMVLEETESGLVLAWTENDMGNIYGAEGTNEIKYILLDGNYESKTIATSEKAITNLCITKMEDEDVLVYAEDCDEDILTSQEKEVFVVDLEGENLGSKEMEFSVLRNVWINGENILLGIKDGSLVSVSSDLSLEIFASEVGLNSISDFIVDNDKIYCIKTQDLTRNIWVLQYIDNTWCKTLLTNEEDYVDYISVSDDMLVYMLTKVDMTLYDDEAAESDIQTTTCIKALGDTEKESVSLDYVEYDAYDFVPGENGKFNVTITNNGTGKMEQVEVIFYPEGENADGSVAVHKVIQVDNLPGETKTYEVDFDMPEDFSAGNYVITLEGGEDSEQQECIELSNPDIGVVSEYIVDESGTYIKIYVANLSYVDTEATYILYDDEGNVLATEEVSLIADECKEFIYTLTEEDMPDDGAAKVYKVVVETNGDEQYTFNNMAEQLIDVQEYVEPTLIVTDSEKEPTPSNPVIPTPPTVGTGENRPIKKIYPVGTPFSDANTKAKYKVTKEGKEVAYVKPDKNSYSSVIIPSTIIHDGVTYKVTAIAKNAFKNNKKIKSITIGNNVTAIGDNAFYKCTALTKISIPSKVKTIGKNAFYGCKKMTSATIGKNVSKIGSKAFYGCSKLKTLKIKTTKLTTKKIGSKAFSKTPKSMKVTVPKKKFKTYKSMLIKKGVNKKATLKKG